MLFFEQFEDEKNVNILTKLCHYLNETVKGT